MHLRKDFVMMGNVCTLRCIVATGGGELRYSAFFFFFFSIMIYLVLVDY
jgi:hypothetical protein